MLGLYLFLDMRYLAIELGLKSFFKADKILFVLLAFSLSLDVHFVYFEIKIMFHGLIYQTFDNILVILTAYNLTQLQLLLWVFGL